MSETGSEVVDSDATAPTESGLTAALAMAYGLLVVPLAVLGSVVFAVLPGPFWVGILVGLIVAAAVLFLRFRSADRVVLSRLEGGLPRSANVERLSNLVQSLSLAAGVTEPELKVLPDGARNALVASCQGRNHLLITSGLLDHLDVVQMEGVVAELLVRLKSGDAEAATTGAALFGRPLVDGPLGPALRPVGAMGFGLLLDDDRDLDADRRAVALTRYPPGLRSALEVMREGDLAPAASTEGLSPLWLVDPNRSGSIRSGIDLRIDVLAEY